MSEKEKNQIIINNYFYISNKELKEFFNQSQIFPFEGIQEKISFQESFLNKIRENSDSKIVKTEIDNGSNDINRRNDNDKKDQNIIIQIGNTKENNFFSKKNIFQQMVIKNMEENQNHPFLRVIIQNFHMITF